MIRPAARRGNLPAGCHGGEPHFSISAACQGHAAHILLRSGRRTWLSMSGGRQGRMWRRTRPDRRCLPLHQPMLAEASCIGGYLSCNYALSLMVRTRDCRRRRLADHAGGLPRRMKKMNDLSTAVPGIVPARTARQFPCPKDRRSRSSASTERRCSISGRSTPTISANICRWSTPAPQQQDHPGGWRQLCLGTPPLDALRDRGYLARHP